MKHSYRSIIRRSIIRAFTLTLTSISCFGAATPIPIEAAFEERELIINDSEVGNELFKFDFHGKWVHEGGAPDRFEGGDEHWTTNSVFGSEYPGVTLRFAGNKVALYGHKVPNGGMARITLDGKDMGTIDLYNASRIEKVLLYESELLSSGEHTINMQLIEETNPAGGLTHEASIDYAVVTTTEDVYPTGVNASIDKITLETGMKYSFSYSFVPEYATVSPEMRFASSDEAVASVSSDGVITANAPGSATITISPADNSFSYNDTITVTVRESIIGTLTAIAGSTNLHTKQEDYYSIFNNLKGNESTELSAIAWQKDIASVKLDLITAGAKLTNVKTSIGSLTNSHGDIIDATLTPYFIKNVLAHDTGKYIPDVLYTSDAVALDPSTVSSVWIQIETSENALPGIYTGEVTVTADELASPETLSLTVEVIGLQKPESDTLVQIWQYPYSSNRYYSGKTTQEYFGEGFEGMWNTHLDPTYEEALRSQILLYKRAGGKSLTVTFVEDPWNSQTPDPYPSMVKWTQKTDGSFTFDYTDMDYFVELNSSCGVDGNILCFSIANWGNRITYFSESENKVVSEYLTLGTDRWKSVWTEFLTDFMKHSKEQGWFDRVYLSMDERPADVVEATLDLVESVTDENGQYFKTSLAVYTFDAEYLFDRITDLQLAIAMTPSKMEEISEHRRELGFTTTLYTCGATHSALSNTPVESLYTYWYIAKIGADGFSRWALDAFNADPLNTTEHIYWAAGDIYLIYPDELGTDNPTAKSSARFEKLAEGERDLTKVYWIMENYPNYSRKLQTALDRVGGDLTTTIPQAQQALNDAARKVALSELIEAAEASEFANDTALADALTDARKLLEGTPTDAELTDAAYNISKLLQTLAGSEETTTPEETTAPSLPEDTDTEEATTANETNPSQPDTTTREESPEADSQATTQNSDDAAKGCKSSLGMSAAAITVGAAAAVALKKKKKESER